jgi:transposase
VKDPASVFPGNGNLPEQEARIRQLERENAQLRQEKEILKKVLGIYSKDTK